MKKKKILYQSDFSLRKTGFGRNSKTVLTYLYNTGKYDIVHYCAGSHVGDPDLLRTPWKSIGCISSSPEEVAQLERDPHLARMAHYGALHLDEVIKQEKPDIYIAVQDIWGVEFAISKPWFNKINSLIWTTLDSLPILPMAIEAAKKIKNYWIWSNFATKELNKAGYGNVKTFHGPLEHDDFLKLPDEKRKELRKKFNIPDNAFVVGFVFRNQLRKSVPNLLEGFSMFKNKNPNSNAKLLLHTHFGEGWNIMNFAKEYKIKKSDILATYVCSSCSNYEVKNFNGQEIPCKFCNSKNSQLTTNVRLGVSEKELNEIYNMMDVYCHPFTSGGQEIPIQEAKLAELITLVTNYSCGEELCQSGSGSLALEWHEYREHNTEFIKASTDPKSICEQLDKVFNMPEGERIKKGKQAREWTIDNYSIQNLGPKLEEFLDTCEIINYDFPEEEPENIPDPAYQMPAIQDDSEWVLHMYHNILKMTTVNKNDDGYEHWMNKLSQGAPREPVEDFFRKTAVKEAAGKQKKEFSEILDKEDEGRRILFVMPKSAGDVFWCTALLKSINEMYPDHNIYFATDPQYLDLLDGNPYVHKAIPYLPIMDNLVWAEGKGENKGYFEISFLPFVGTQRILNYMHNGKDKIAFDIKNKAAFTD